MAAPTSPSYEFSAITPSDTTILSYNGVTMPCRGIYVGVGGSLVVKNDVGTTVTFVNATAGAIYPISCTQVLAATSATNLIALY